MNDVESMVNKNADMRSYAKHFAAAKRRQLRLERMLLSIKVLAAIAIFVIFLGAIDAIHFMLATVIAIMSTMAACFALGMYIAMVIRK